MSAESNQHSSLSGLRYAGSRNYVYDNGRSERLYVLTIDHENGPWEVIRCKTEAQARELAGLFEQFEVARAALEQIAAGPSWIGRLDPKAHLSETQRFARDTLDSFPASSHPAHLHSESAESARPAAWSSPEGQARARDRKAQSPASSGEVSNQ